MATGGAGNLGGASFTVTANTAQFQQGLQQAQQTAQQATHVIVDNFKGIQYQLSAINATAMTTTTAIRDLAVQLSTASFAGTRGGAGMHQFGTSSKYASMGLLYLSQAIEDAQYGFNAIVNNIPLIVMAMGGSAGVAGAVSIAAVAINQLISHWGQLSDLLQSAWSGGAIDQLAKIRERAEEAAKAFEKLAAAPTKMESEAAAHVKEFTTENFKAMYKGLSEAIGQHPGMRADVAVAPEGAMIGGAPGVIPTATKSLAQRQKEAGEKALELNRQKARELITEAEKPGEAGEPARQRIRALAAQFPGAFPKGAAEAFSPEAAEEKRVKEENIRADIQGRKNIREYDKKEAAERERLNKILTETGEKYEKESKIEQLQDEKEYFEKELAKAKRGMTGSQRQQLEDEIIGSRAPQEAKIMSTKAYVNATMTAAGSQIPQQQLGHLKSMDDRIKEIAKEIKNYGRLQ